MQDEIDSNIPININSGDRYPTSCSESDIVDEDTPQQSLKVIYSLQITV